MTEQNSLPIQEQLEWQNNRKSLNCPVLDCDKADYVTFDTMMQCSDAPRISETQINFKELNKLSYSLVCFLRKCLLCTRIKVSNLIVTLYYNG